MATEKEKEKAVKPWIELTQEKLSAAEKGFIHYTGKVVHSSVGDVGIRIESDKSRPELPYLALGTLGASLNDLDFTAGGAAGIPFPRQVKDVVTGVSSGVDRDLSNVHPSQLEELSEGSLFVNKLKKARKETPDAVPTLLKQIILNDEKLGDVVVTPVGALALSKRIMDRLSERLGEKQEIEDKRAEEAFAKKVADAEAKGKKAPKEKKSDKPVKVRPFWRRAQNILGGAKPQNVGLLCAVAGGPMLASFAWHFPVPRFPTVKKQKVYLTVFKSVSLAMSPEQKVGFLAKVEKVKDDRDYHNQKALQFYVESVVKDLKLRASRLASSLSFELEQDYKKDGIEVDGKSLDMLILQNQLPMRKEAVWEAVRQKSKVEKAWLLPSLRDVDWAEEAASQVVGRWLSQSGILIDSADIKKITDTVEKELMR